MASTSFNWTPVLIASLVVSIGQFSMGLVFPSLPWIALSLNISAEDAQKLISFYLLGFGPSQLIYGPISDAIGRKPILLTGLSLTLLGLTIVLCGNDSFGLLTLGRFVQGLGAGCCAVLARASLRDSYQHDELAQALSWLTIVASFTPIIAPVLGGFINHYLGWYAVFVSLFSYIAIVFTLLFFIFKETLPQKEKVPNLTHILITYSQFLRSRYFISFATIGWLNFSLVVLTISMMPFIMQIEIGMSSDQYALWALIPAFGLLTGSSLSNRIRPKIGIKKTLFIAPILHSSAGLWLIFCPATPLAMMLGQFFLTMGNGLALPCAQTQLLMPYQKKAGSAAAVSGAGQMIISSLLSMLLMSLGINHAWHLGLVIMIFAMISVIAIINGFNSVP
ncbi:MFS transporter [Psychromonas sp. PT13]|uniref:MFS transporter n=1 Tax=Psychromonas sp. PT13 TaxID=3439547 RepID=UPI003EBD8A21